MNSLSHREDIQGLRALAVLAVMLFHLNPSWLPGGFIGVDIFFVISGYLITTILTNKREHPDYRFLSTISNFYISRFKRIAPAYFVMLMFVALVAAIFFIPSDFNTFRIGLNKAAWFSTNNYFSTFGDYFAPANHEQPLLHTWSLAVEIQFYLLVPFVVLLLPVKTFKWVLALLLIGLTFLAEYRLRVLGLEQATYYTLFARLPEFFAGCLVAIFTRTVSVGRWCWLSLLGFMLIIILFYFQPRMGAFPGISALMPALGSSLLLAAPPTSIANRWLSSKILVLIGTLSYSLYLWHWPVLGFLRYYTGAEILTMYDSIVFVVLTIILSLASYYGVENAFRSKLTSRKQLTGLALLLLGVVVILMTMSTVNKTFTSEALSIEYQRYADNETICHGKIVGDCLRGNLTSNREVLVLGDSHAAMLNQFFDYLGKKLNFKARIITASSCVTIPEFDYQRIPEWAQKACLSQLNAAAHYIQSSNVIFLAGAWQYQTQFPTFYASLNHFLSHIKSEQHLFVLSQVPQLSNSPQRVQRFNNLGFPIVFNVDVKYLESNKKIEKLLPNQENIHFLNLSDLPVFDHAPLYYDDNSKYQLIYFDDNHLNEVGARHYAKGAENIISVFMH